MKTAQSSCLEILSFLTASVMAASSELSSARGHVDTWTVSPLVTGCTRQSCPTSQIITPPTPSLNANFVFHAIVLLPLNPTRAPSFGTSSSFPVREFFWTMSS